MRPTCTLSSVDLDDLATLTISNAEIAKRVALLEVRPGQPGLYRR
jgi:hypothetical protein